MKSSLLKRRHLQYLFVNPSHLAYVTCLRIQFPSLTANNEKLVLSECDFILGDRSGLQLQVNIH